MAEITITKALSRLKILESRYNKAVDNLSLVAVKHGSKLRSPNSTYKVEDFEKKAKEDFQSVMDLYDNIVNLKYAIAESNNTTVITIAGQEMTVQKAIILKQYIEQKSRLLRKMKTEMNSARNSYEDALDENEQRIERMLSGNDDKSQKSSVRKETEEYISSTMAVELIDPCNLQEQIPKFEENYSDFVGNIDYALSESNSITKIEIPDSLKI